MPKLARLLTDDERWRLHFLRHSYRGGRDYVYPPAGTVDPRYGARSRPELYVDADGVQRVRGTNVGGGSFLFAHDRETPEDFALRLAQSYAINICGPVVARYVSTVYKAEPRREVPPEHEALLADFDRQGTNATAFFRDACTWALVYGSRLFVATDTPEVEPGEQEQISEADRIARRLEPYSYVVRPTSVLNWSVNDDDTLVGITVDEGPAVLPFDPFRKPDEKPPPRRVRVWTPDAWVLFHVADNDDAQIVKQGPGFGFVPFVPVVFRPVPDGCAYEGRSLIEDVADIQLEIYNELSLLQDLHRHQGSQFLAVPKALGGGSVSTQEEITLGTKAYVEVTGGMPQYVGPTVDHAVEKRNHIGWLVARAMEAVGLIKRGRDSNETASGESLRWEHAEFHDLAASIADMMEEAERAVLAQREAIRSGSSDVESVRESITVAYSRDYQPLDPIAESEALAAELALQLGPAVEVELKADYVQRRLGHLGAERVTELRDELEAAAEADALKREADAMAAKANAERAMQPAPAMRFGMPRPPAPQPPPSNGAALA